MATTEYVNGVAQKTAARFRAYDSYEQSFQDYAQLINQSPRYGVARQNTGSPAAYAAEWGAPAPPGAGWAGMRFATSTGAMQMAPMGLPAACTARASFSTPG